MATTGSKIRGGKWYIEKLASQKHLIQSQNLRTFYQSHKFKLKFLCVIKSNFSLLDSQRRVPASWILLQKRVITLKSQPNYSTLTCVPLISDVLLCAKVSLHLFVILIIQDIITSLNMSPWQRIYCIHSKFLRLNASYKGNDLVVFCLILSIFLKVIHVCTLSIHFLG